MGSGRITRTIIGLALGILGISLLAACARGSRAAVDGVLVFDEVIALERGKEIDNAKREFPVDGSATFVAMVDEDDSDVKVEMSHPGAMDVAAAKIKVDSVMESEGIEIAVLDVPRGARLTVSLESAPSFDRPGRARLRVVRYHAGASADSRVAARLAALRDWSAATGTHITGEDFRKTAFRDIDRALAHLESAEGDAALAAWGRQYRSRLNYRQFTDLKDSLADAERAERGFAAIGALRNAARGRIQQAAVLVDIAHDKAAKDPDAEEAARRARGLLIALSAEPSLSALERTRAVNFLGVLAFHVYDLPEARLRFQAVIPAFEAIGNYTGRLTALGNLAAIALEEGDYRGATQYYDQVIVELDRFESTFTRASHLHNAARIDTHAGNIDRAIERYLRALELTRVNKMQPNEARILQGLGLAYWARGDNAQAMTLTEEALRLRRTLDDSFGLGESLGVLGSLARESGDIKKALALHREVLTLTASTNTRVLTLLDLALDYQAESNYQHAIATAREALSVRVSIPNFYLHYVVRLALADMLLAQPHRTLQAVREATILTQDSLKAAMFRADTPREIAAHRLLAQSHVTRGELREAREEYEKAIALIFNYRSRISNPELRAASLTHEQQTFRGYVDLLMRDVARRGPDKLLTAGPAEEEALRTLEWARAINFDQGRVSQLDAAAQARLDDLLTQMAGKRVRIAALLERTDDVMRELEILRVEIAQLRAEVDQLRSAASRTAKVDEASTVVSAPWPAISPGTTQFSYALETEHAYLWVREASGIRVTMLSASPATIARDVAAVVASARSRETAQLDAALARLSTALLPPGALGRGSTTLEIVAEGQITAIPIAALSSPSENPRPLAERRSIVMIGSLFAANALPRPTQAHPLAFVGLANDANPKGDASAALVFPALHSASAEARAIAAQFRRLDPPANVKLLLGAEGSAATLEDTWNKGVDVIHFATHGLADLRQPLASLLLLPALDAAGAPTYLTAGQVQEWSGDANLVFLSACDTAVGPARFAGGLPGLQRAFLRAGARGVIATLWPVEDVYAGQFAADFYRRYIAGLQAPQALSETQQAWMQAMPGIRESELTSRRMTAWAHVYYAQ